MMNVEIACGAYDRVVKTMNLLEPAESETKLAARYSSKQNINRGNSRRKPPTKSHSNRCQPCALSRAYGIFGGST